MQKEPSALLVHRENYIVPKGQERSVHYRIAKVDTKGNFLERPRICKDNPKEFDSSLKRNLEILGYTVEILFHPLGTYTDTRIVDKDAVMRAKDAEIAELKAKVQKGADDALKEKDAEIAKLKEALAKAKAKEAEEAPKESQKPEGGKGKTDNK
jgi:hypothetical protein|nr:MAG TPA: hypothetical protein [Caudoviricetes sp.]